MYRHTVFSTIQLINCIKGLASPCVFFSYIAMVSLTQVVKFPDSQELVFRNPTLGWINPAQRAEQSLKNMSDNVSGINTLRPRQNERHFADDIFKCIFLNENTWISIKISLRFVPEGPINIIPALVQIMAWRRTGDKPLSEPMMIQFNDAYMCHSASMS